MSAVLDALPIPRRLRPALLLAGLMALGGSLGANFHLHERLLHDLGQAWRADRPGAMAVGLDGYRATLQQRAVAGVDGNLSGLSWDADRRQLWAVVNNPETLLALNAKGDVIGRYPLQGFSDVEGVAYLGDDWLVLTEEREQRLVILPAPRHDGPLDRRDARSLSLVMGEAGNAGFEGLGYDARGDRLFVVKERAPRKLYEIRGLKRSLAGQALNLTVLDRSAWLDGIGMATDLSSVHFDARSGHLLLLSDEAKLVLELDGDGRLVDYRSLWAGFAGLDASVPQAEGMAMSDDGGLYLVSEPNLFYRFERQ